MSINHLDVIVIPVSLKVELIKDSYLVYDLRRGKKLIIMHTNAGHGVPPTCTVAEETSTAFLVGGVA